MTDLLAGRGDGADVLVGVVRQRLAAQLDAPLEFLTSLNDPRDLYAYCFCDVR